MSTGDRQAVQRHGCHGAKLVANVGLNLLEGAESAEQPTNAATDATGSGLDNSRSCKNCADCSKARAAVETDDLSVKSACKQIA